VKKSIRAACSKAKLLAVIVPVALALAAGGIVAARLLAAGKTPPDPVVFTVNGEPVTEREYLLSVSHERAGVLTGFIAQGADQGDPDFWVTPVDGQTPLQAVKEAGLKRAARVKAIQAQCKKLGLAGDISFGGFLAYMKDENARRDAAVRAGEPIYGPQQYTEQVLFDIQESNMEDALKKAVAPDLALSDDELYQYYLNGWNNVPTEAGWITIEKLSADFDPDDEQSNASVHELMRVVMERGKLGAAFSDLPGDYPGVGYTTQYLDLRRGSGDPNQQASIQAAQDLDVGEISDLYQDQNAWAVLKVTGRSDVEYKSFDDVKADIQNYELEVKFGDYLDNLANSADIQINGAAYDNIDDALLEG